MTEILPNDLIDRMTAARKDRQARKSRLRVRVGGSVYPVLRVWDGGFAVDAGTAHLRGRVDLYLGAQHLSQCLVVAGAEASGEMTYEFKQNTRATDRAPLDFAAEDPATWLLAPN